MPSHLVFQNSTTTTTYMGVSAKDKCDKINHIFPDICAHSRSSLNHKRVHKMKMYSPIREWIGSGFYAIHPFYILKGLDRTKIEDVY